MNALLNIIRTSWISITLFLLALITILSLTPLPSIPSAPGSDKMHHFIAYSAVTFPFFLRKPDYWLVIVLFFVFWSGSIELLQPYVNRSGEWLDMAANGAGIGCGFLLALFINWIFPVRLQRK